MPDNWLLITLDVISMYTNICHSKGLQAVRDVMINYLIYDDPIIERLELSLKSNDFLFNDEWFIQKVGTSMGKDCAPHYGDIYMTRAFVEFLIEMNHPLHLNILISIGSVNYLDTTVFKDSKYQKNPLLTKDILFFLKIFLNIYFNCTL